jgi:hypothetical protein
MNTYSKPDYVIDSSGMIISPSYLSIGDDSFNVKIYIYNIARAITDSVHLLVTRKYPNGTSATVLSTWIQNIFSTDYVSLNLPIEADRDAGTGYITATINDLNTVPELSLANNTGTISYTINNTDVRPIYPYNYSIINVPSLTLYASTENPLAPSTQYEMQIDTTTLFNSPVLRTQNVTSTGGVLSFPNISLPLDSTVYYWRVAKAVNPNWYGFSFIHNSKASSGFEQGHFYQNTQSSLSGLVLDSATRQYNFSPGLTNVFVEQTIYPTGGDEDNQFSVSVNGSFVSESACVGSSIIFNVFDTLTFNPWANTTDPFGAAPPCLPDRLINFEYSTLTSNWRDSAVQFFNSIPNGDYVIAREIYNLGDNDFASVWASDTLIYGSGNSLYNVFKSQGIPIDSFDYPRTFIFLFRKNDSTNFPPLSVFTQGIYDDITLSQNINTTDTSGTILSPKFGPGLAWYNMLWNGYIPDSFNTTTVNIIGINNNGVSTVLDTISNSQHNVNISSVSPTTYPYLQLQLNTQDSTTSPYQLQNWSVQYSPAPEGGLAPNLGFSIPDTIAFQDAGGVVYDSLPGYVVFENVSPVNFDSIYLRIIMYDSTNNADTFILPKTKPLPAGDTMHVSFNINLEYLKQGLYNFLLEVNPPFQQPEEYLFNDLLYKYIYLERNNLATLSWNLKATPVNNTVNGQWMVMNESGVTSYQLQHSTDGVNFSPVGDVTPTPDKAATKNYSLIHTNPVDGINYYRVKMTKTGGGITYSNVQEVDFGTEIRVYPNPFVSTINVSVTAASPGNYTVRIINASGQEVMHKAFSGAAASFDMSSLAAGSYIVTVDDGIQVKTFKLQKQH